MVSFSSGEFTHIIHNDPIILLIKIFSITKVKRRLRSDILPFDLFVKRNAAETSDFYQRIIT
jgi:hypothetical protein